ncbi:MAG: hypothetical protein NTW40_03420 [Acidobacteria bacterium]|nr:hypothetical protein [Acidobacteriota bacterium]
MTFRTVASLLLGAFLALNLTAEARSEGGSQLWLLALDARGGPIGDLRPDELELKVGGKVRPVTDLQTPDQLATATQSWILVFEPIRDTSYRAIAFTAAADFLTKVPEGDQVFLVARGRDSLESLLPGLSLDRAAWAKALERVPAMLPESLTGLPTGKLEGQGFQPLSKLAAPQAGGQEALNALLARFKTGATTWAGGTTDQKGRSAQDRLNLLDATMVSGFVQAVGREMKTLESLLDSLAPVPGQKHMIVFSRCESDDLNHPSLKVAMNQNWSKQRVKGDLGGPGETATLAVRDITIQQLQLKAKSVKAGVMIYSVAGSSPNVTGNMGPLAPDTGGFCFPLRAELESQLGQAMQVFGSRHLLRWAPAGSASPTAPVELSVKRKGVRVIAPTLTATP